MDVDLGQCVRLINFAACISQWEPLLEQTLSLSILARAEIVVEDPYEKIRQFAGELLIWARRAGTTPLLMD